MPWRADKVSRLASETSPSHHRLTWYRWYRILLRWRVAYEAGVSAERQRVEMEAVVLRDPCQRGTETGAADRQRPSQKLSLSQGRELVSSGLRRLLGKAWVELVLHTTCAGERITATPAAVGSDGGREDRVSCSPALLLGQLAGIGLPYIQRCTVLLRWSGRGGVVGCWAPPPTAHGVARASAKAGGLLDARPAVVGMRLAHCLMAPRVAWVSSAVQSHLLFLSCRFVLDDSRDEGTQARTAAVRRVLETPYVVRSRPLGAQAVFHDRRIRHPWRQEARAPAPNPNTNTNTTARPRPHLCSG